MAAPNASPALDDTAGGLALFLIFVGAVLVVTAAVVLVALLRTWWVLGVAIAIHVLMTTIVVMTILSVMDGRTSMSVKGAHADRRGRETRTPTYAGPVATP